MKYLIQAEEIIKRHEGLSLSPYECPEGKLTIGYGRNLESRGISPDEAVYLLMNDIHKCDNDLCTFPYWEHLSDDQKAGLLSLRFCVGALGYRKFVKMNAAMERGDYKQAALEVLDSRFAIQTGRRARDIAELLRHGKDSCKK